MTRSNRRVWGRSVLGLVLLACLLGATASDPPAGGGRLVGNQVAATSNGTTTVPNGNIFTGASGFKQMAVVVNITSGGTDGGTVQLYLQDSADQGVTWNDLVATMPFTFGSAVVTQRFYVSDVLPQTGAQLTRMQGQAEVTETLLPGTARQGPWGNRLRVREVVSNITGSPTGATYNVDVLLK